MSNILDKNVVRDYWHQSPTIQQAQLNALKQRELEEEAREKEMLIYKGKLIRPEDYPCKCEMEDPEQCYRDLGRSKRWNREEREDKQCYCPCHTYFEPF